MFWYLAMRLVNYVFTDQPTMFWYLAMRLVNYVFTDQSTMFWYLAMRFVNYVFTDQVPVEYDEPEFVWEEYLEGTGASAAPPTSFTHVSI